MLRGSCLCKAVKYEIQGLSTPIQHCYCSTCRKAHASAYTSVAAVNCSDFRWLSGEYLLYQFESSPGKFRLFCSKCGTHLIKEVEGRSELILRVATLDDDPKQIPQSKIWLSHEAPWLSDRCDLLVHDQGGY